jgi:hypothetical protein
MEILPMTLLFLSACSSIEDDEDWSSPEEAVIAEEGTASVQDPEPFPPPPEGVIHLCVSGAPGFLPPAATWVFVSNDGHMGQVTLEMPWRQGSRCGLIQEMFVHSGLTFRSQSPFSAGTIGGMSYHFEDGSLHRADRINNSAGGPGYFEMIFFPFVPPGE